MKYFQSALVLVLFFVPLFTTQAQMPCGNIIAPVDPNNPTVDIVTTPVTNCDDPFNKTVGTLSPYTLHVHDTVIHEGDTVDVPEGGINNFYVEGHPLLSGANHLFFLHDGNDYRYIDTRPLPPTEADYRTFASTFFAPGTDIEPYIQAAVSGDYTTLSDSAQTTYFNFIDYVDLNFPQIPAPLRAGTYTLVSKEFQLILSEETFLQKLFAFVVPTAHAQDYPENIFTLTFTITEMPPTPTGASSVLFLPGIQASRLYKDGILGTEDQLWEPNDNQDLRQLSMNGSGVSDNTVYTRDIMREIFGISNVYLGFSEFMDELVSDGIIKRWSPYAYDWRYGVDDIAEDGTQYENEIRDAVAEVERLAQDSFSGKVTLLGHSNGGLLAKAIMIRLEREGKSGLVDRVIFLASPQLGTPKAIGTILHGYDQEALGGLVIDDAIARDVIQNLPGAYGLIPTQKYFDVRAGNMVFFDTSSSTQLFRQAYGNAINNESELSLFMTGGDGRSGAQTVSDAGLANPSMLHSALVLHRDALDNWGAPAGVEVVEVVGEGLNTVSGFEYNEYTERVCDAPDIFGIRNCTNKQFYKPKPYISQYGDETVMAPSAEGYVGNKKTYYVDLDASDIKGGAFAVEHASFTENPSIQELVKNILQQATSTNIEFISESRPTYNNDRILLGAHSPVTMEVTDTMGRRVGRAYVGPNHTPFAEHDIPGSSYLEIGDSTYIVLPANITYDIKIKGIDEGGLTFTLDRLHGETQTPEVSVRVATITPSTTIKISYATNTLSNLSVDSNGDGKTDVELTPKGEVVVPVVTYTMLRTAVQNLPLSAIRKAPLTALVGVAEALHKKTPKTKAITLLEQLTLTQLGEALKLYVQKKWLTQVQVDPILQMIHSLSKV